MSVESLSVDNFDLGEGITIVDFWAPWCGPCRALTPSLEKMASKYEDSVTVKKVDVQANPALGAKYKVRSIPCVIVFEDGEEIDRMIGFAGEPSLENLFIKHG